MAQAPIKHDIPKTIFVRTRPPAMINAIQRLLRKYKINGNPVTIKPNTLNFKGADLRSINCLVPARATTPDISAAYPELNDDNKEELREETSKQLLLRSKQDAVRVELAKILHSSFDAPSSSSDDSFQFIDPASPNNRMWHDHSQSTMATIASQHNIPPTPAQTRNNKNVSVNSGSIATKNKKKNRKMKNRETPPSTDDESDDSRHSNIKRTRSRSRSRSRPRSRSAATVIKDDDNKQAELDRITPQHPTDDGSNSSGYSSNDNNNNNATRKQGLFEKHRLFLLNVSLDSQIQAIYEEFELPKDASKQDYFKLFKKRVKRLDQLQCERFDLAEQFRRRVKQLKKDGIDATTEKQQAEGLYNEADAAKEAFTANYENYKLFKPAHKDKYAKSSQKKPRINPRRRDNNNRNNNNINISKYASPKQLLSDKKRRQAIIEAYDNPRYHSLPRHIVEVKYFVFCVYYLLLSHTTLFCSKNVF